MFQMCDRAGLLDVNRVEEELDARLFVEWAAYHRLEAERYEREAEEGDLAATVSAGMESMKRDPRFRGRLR